ncbi:MAG: PD40 domain-containing protein, partial [Planctomycetales bacterium]|nr:PD40 domain-containing protein [Planctomycetales bacterium]
YVVFESDASNLDALGSDTNSFRDVYCRDLLTGTTQLVSVAPSGAASGDGWSFSSRISADGRFVAFVSEAGNLTNVADGNQSEIVVQERRDVFVRDMQTGVTSVLSSRGNHRSDHFSVTPDFAEFAFETRADNLVPGDVNSQQDVVLYEASSSAATLLSRRDPSLPAEILGGGGLSSVTPDGRYVAFNAAGSTDYAPGVTFTGFQTGSAYVRDRLTGELAVVDLTTDPSVSGGGFNPILTPDGRFVAFWSRVPTGGSTPLLDDIDYSAGDFFWGRDVYLRDMEAGVTQIISVDPSGTQSNNGQGVFSPLEHAVSDDGRYVAFTSKASNLIDDVANPSGFVAIYLRDTWTQTTTLVSHNIANDRVITGSSFNLSMTADGRFITFTSQATDLTANDDNGQPDVFQWNRETDAVELLSVNDAGAGPGNGDSGGATGFRPQMSADGRFVAFASRASNLIAGDVNNVDDIFVRDTVAGSTTLASVSSGGVPANLSSSYPAISPNGAQIAFISFANNISAVPIAQFGNQLYVHDLTTGETTLASVNSSGASSGNRAVVLTSNAADWPTFSDDGRYIAFRSEASDLVEGFVEQNQLFQPDVFVRDLQNETTQLVTYDDSGTGGSSQENAGVKFLFANGEKAELFFDSNSGDLFPGDRNVATDVFAFDLAGRGRVAGTVLADVDENGVFDNDEDGLAGIAVFLDSNSNGRPDVGEPRVVTDAGGNYAFNNLGAGVYHFGALLPGGFESTTPQIVAVSVADDNSKVNNQNFGGAASMADLSVSRVAAASAVDAGRAFTVTWRTSNLADEDVDGAWQEAVYLSKDKVLDGADSLIGTIAHEGGLSAFGKADRSLTVAAPPALTGEYFVFVQADRRSQISADTNRTNNIAFAFNLTRITIPELTPGARVDDQFTAVQQNRYYQVDVEPGRTVRLTLDSAAVSGGTELYASFDDLPTAYNFEHAARDADQPDQTLSIPLTRPGTYFVLARSRSGDAATAPFTLAAQDATFEVNSIDLDAAPASGSVTIKISGAGFSQNTSATMERVGNVIAASSVQFQDAATIFATFDLNGQSIGGHDMRVEDGSESSTLVDAFEVLPSVPQQDALQVFLLNPEFARAGRVGTVVVEYSNAGAVDIPAPLLRLEAEGAALRLEGQAAFTQEGVSVLGVADSGPAGVLRPGRGGRVEFEFLADPDLGVDIQFKTFLIDPAAAMDWAGVKDAVRPAHISPEAWNAIFANYLTRAGTTVGDYETMLDQAASYLSGVGVRTPDTLRLLNLAIASASGTFDHKSLAAVVDSVQPASGFDLEFNRQHGSSVDDRYVLGPFGRGWQHNWDGEVIATLDGLAVVRLGANRRVFAQSPDGTYVGLNGDTGQLTSDGSAFALTEVDGAVVQFRTDGQFGSYTDTNGNAVAAGYDASGRLMSLAHSSGPSINLTYNGAGFVESLSDSAGRTVTYSYAGDHLTSYADQFGSHTYTYVSDQGAAKEHALESVNFSDDTHVMFAYDDFGRLLSEERDGGLQRLLYEYKPFGGYAVTDAAGGVNARLFDDRGLLVREVDALGNTFSYSYDADLNLTRVDAPLGIVGLFSYDDFGNLVTATDPLGRETALTYDARANLTSYTDALGRATAYKYDAAGNLIGIDYVNGASEQFAYDAEGGLLSSVNRRGQTTRYETNAAGQITKKTYADGTTVDYAYDARGRIYAAADDSGTIALTYSDLDVLERVDYPDGKFLDFEYNIVGQRTRVLDQDGFVVNYGYDDLGRLDALTNSTGGLIIAYQYDAAGRLSREDKGNGTFATYDYDLAGQLLTLTYFAPGGGLNSRFEYSYDALGRRTSETLTDDDPATDDGATRYQYDALGQLIQVETPAGRVIQYQYDAVGNRISVIDDGVVTTYETNNVNEYTRVGDARFTYDADGNRISKTNASGTTISSFDSDNLLTSVAGAGVSASFVYNALNQKVSSTLNGVETQYLIDPLGHWTINAQYDAAGAAIARYAYGPTLVSQFASDGATYFYEYDANSNTSGLTGPTGDYANRYSYTPFGETTTISAAVANEFTFVGGLGIASDATGLAAMRARIYDPTVGQFISNDPTGITAGDPNLRRYVANRPTQFVDPSGLSLVPAKVLVRIPQAAASNVCPAKPKPKPESNPKAPSRSPIQIINYGGKVNVTNTGSAVNIDSGGSSVSVTNIGGTTTVVIVGGGGDPGNAPTGSGSTGGGNQGECSSPPGDPGGPTDPGPDDATKVVGSFDPNDIAGPAGFSAEHFVRVDPVMPFRIRFENKGDATAPAQEVFVTHTLDEHLDLATFELGDMGFGSVVVDLPVGLQSYAASVDYQNLDGSPLHVDVFAELNLETRTVEWTFRSVDPGSGLLPAGIFD